MNAAEICRKNNWTRGTYLSNDQITIVVTAVGDDLILYRYVTPGNPEHECCTLTIGGFVECEPSRIP